MTLALTNYDRADTLRALRDVLRNQGALDWVELGAAENLAEWMDRARPSTGRGCLLESGAEEWEPLEAAGYIQTLEMAATVVWEQVDGEPVDNEQAAVLAILQTLNDPTLGGQVENLDPVRVETDLGLPKPWRGVRVTLRAWRKVWR